MALQESQEAAIKAELQAYLEFTKVEPQEILALTKVEVQETLAPIKAEHLATNQDHTSHTSLDQATNRAHINLQQEATLLDQQQLEPQH